MVLLHHQAIVEIRWVSTGSV